MMPKKLLAHKGLSLLFQREGVPNTVVIDGAREQTSMGRFHKKCTKEAAGACIKPMEPHTPWSNSAETAIRELKMGVRRQIVRFKATKHLWDNCLEREAMADRSLPTIPIRYMTSARNDYKW
jgi:hypothetical protein